MALYGSLLGNPSSGMANKIRRGPIIENGNHQAPTQLISSDVIEGLYR